MKRKATSKKSRVAPELEMEQPRRAAVEDVDFVNSFNSSMAMVVVEKEKSPSDDDTSFEDPYDFNYANYDQFRTMMTKHCSKTYTDAKQAPKVSQFDTLLNKLNQQDQRSERPSSSRQYLPEEIETSSSDDDEILPLNPALDIILKEKKTPKNKKAKAVHAKPKKVSPKIFEIDDKSSTDVDDEETRAPLRKISAPVQLPLPKSGRNKKRTAPQKDVLAKSSKKAKENNTIKTAKTNENSSKVAESIQIPNPSSVAEAHENPNPSNIAEANVTPSVTAETDENSLRHSRRRRLVRSKGSGEGSDEPELPDPVSLPAEVVKSKASVKKSYTKSKVKPKPTTTKEKQTPKKMPSTSLPEMSLRRHLRPRQEKSSTSTSSRLRK